MAQKSNKPAVTGDVRAKAQAMRLDQQRADARVRNIIIGVVVMIVLAVSAAVAWVIVTSDEIQADQGNVDAAAVLAGYADGSPIVVSHKGVGTADEALPTLTENFDYSCPACNVVGVGFGAPLVEGMKAGKYNLEFRPVVTHNAPWNSAATTASLVVANKAPEKWVEFHEALMAYAFNESQQGRGTTVNNLPASAKQVKVIAQEVGLPQELIDSIPVNAATEYLEKSSIAWQKMQVEGRQGFGTPEFVATVDGKAKKIELSTFEPEKAVSEIHAALGVK